MCLIRKFDLKSDIDNEFITTTHKPYKMESNRFHGSNIENFRNSCDNS